MSFSQTLLAATLHDVFLFIYTVFFRKLIRILKPMAEFLIESTVWLGPGARDYVGLVDKMTSSYTIKKG
jgi:hypothetical protein